MESTCEMYILNDGSWQCGNCGEVHEEEPEYCHSCGAIVESVVDEGEADDDFWEQ